MKLLFLLIPSFAIAATNQFITLEWDANPPFDNVTNYTALVGDKSRSYTNSYLVGTNLMFEFPVFKERPGLSTNFFAVTAQNESDTSDLSEEVFWTRKWLTTPYITLVGTTASWTTVAKATNYTFMLTSLTWGTNAVLSFGTNTSSTVPDMTNGVWNLSVKADSSVSESKWGVKRVINVPLNLPAGKFYVEKGSTITNWFTVGTFTGPTTVWFPANQPMGFFRYRSYFMSASSAKGGATKLMATPAVKASLVKSKPIAITNQPPAIIGPINLMPPKP